VQCDVGPLTLETRKQGATGKRGFSPCTVDSGEQIVHRVDALALLRLSAYSSFVSGAGGQRGNWGLFHCVAGCGGENVSQNKLE
jgi:hypothetical protein